MDKLSLLLGEIQKGLQNIAPDAIAATSRAIRAECICNLVGSLLWMVVVVLYFFKFRYIVKIYIDNTCKCDPDGVMIGVNVVAAIMSVFFFIFFMCVWFDATTWMGLFDQKAYIASKILHAISK